jgi:hypothetical protein
MKNFQKRVMLWLDICFTPEIAYVASERNHRFLEEALELVQANNCTKEEALKLVDYVFDRPVGEFKQEVGGVMVTLAALCGIMGTDMHADGEVELLRINRPETIQKIRRKQLTKPSSSPLPGSEN